MYTRLVLHRSKIFTRADKQLRGEAVNCAAGLSRTLRIFVWDASLATVTHLEKLSRSALDDSEGEMAHVSTNTNRTLELPA